MVMAASTYILLKYLQDSSDESDELPRKKSDVINAFRLTDRKFESIFRLRKSTAKKLCQQLRPSLEPRSEVSTVLTVERKVLCALRFYATGAYQKVLSQEPFLAMSQQSVSNSIIKVTEAINATLLTKYISFPKISEYADIQAKFMSRFEFPKVIGAIGCTHIPIETPPQHDALYQERYYGIGKMYHSVNAQLICDADLRIININSRYPGSSEDSFIWISSKLRTCLVDENSGSADPLGWLLGDGGYPLEPWLLTPVTEPQTAAEIKYNTFHSKARSVIEKCNSVLKSRFRCLCKHRTLKYKPTMASKIVNACAVLHNMCIEDRINPPTDIRLDEDDSMYPPCEEIIETLDISNAQSVREKVIETYFA